MEIKDWLPGVGIVLGWLLSQLGVYFRDNREDRQLLSVAITGFLYSYFDRVRYRQLLKILNLKLGDKLEEISKLEIEPDKKIELNNKLLVEVEGARQVLLRDPPETEERNKESLNNALISISKVDPILAYQAKALIEDDHLYKNTDLTRLLSKPLVYLESYGSLLGSVESHTEEFSGVIKMIAFRHGILCYARTMFLLWWENRRLKDNDERVSHFLNAFQQSEFEQSKIDERRTEPYA